MINETKEAILSFILEYYKKKTLVLGVRRYIYIGYWSAKCCALNIILWNYFQLCIQSIDFDTEPGLIRIHFSGHARDYSSGPANMFSGLYADPKLFHKLTKFLDTIDINSFINDVTDTEEAQLYYNRGFGNWHERYQAINPS